MKHFRFVWSKFLRLQPGLFAVAYKIKNDPEKLFFFPLPRRFLNLELRQDPTKIAISCV